MAAGAPAAHAHAHPADKVQPGIHCGAPAYAKKMIEMAEAAAILRHAGRRSAAPIESQARRIRNQVIDAGGGKGSPSMTLIMRSTPAVMPP